MPFPVSWTDSRAIRVPVKEYVAVLPALSLQWSSLQKHCVAQPVPEFHVPVYLTEPDPLERPSSLIQWLPEPGSPEGRFWVAPMASGVPRFGLPSAFQPIFWARVVRLL